MSALTEDSGSTLTFPRDTVKIKRTAESNLTKCGWMLASDVVVVL